MERRLVVGIVDSKSMQILSVLKNIMLRVLKSLQNGALVSCPDALPFLGEVEQAPHFSAG